MTERKTKLNSSCIKMFEFLKLLYNDEADYTTVLNLFKDEVKNTSLNSMQVILGKYINTLKYFGINVQKDYFNDKFFIHTTNFSEDFTKKDLNAISIIKDMAKNYPDQDTVNGINKLIHSLEIRMDSKTRATLHNLNSKYDFSFYFYDIKEQIEKCQHLCKNKHFINILYKKGKKDILCNCIPQEVLYENQSASLKVFSNTKNMSYKIPINKILSIKIMPKVAPLTQPSGGSYVYKLTGRLAKTYSLKDNESFIDIKPNYVVVNCINEPVNELILRLMRYMDCCEILRPIHLRDMMKNMIHETLNNYNEKSETPI